MYPSQEDGIAVAVTVGSGIEVGGTTDGVGVGGTDVGTVADAGAHPLAKTDRKMNTMTNKIDFFIALSLLPLTPSIMGQAA